MSIRSILPAMLFATQASFGQADDGKTIEWLAVNYPPLSIQEGSSAGSGYLDQLMAALQPLFPGFKHTIIYGNSTRLEQEMKRGHNTCTISMQKTPEREQYMVFSKPYTKILPNGIIALGLQIGRFTQYADANGRISLSRVLADHSLTLGISQGRLYSKPLNQLLDPLLQAGAPQIQVLSGNKIAEGVYRLLQRRQIDYMLGFPMEEQYFYKHTPNSLPTVYLPVSEDYEAGDRYFGCSRTAWGQQRVEQMNRLLESKALRQRLQDIYESQLSPESVKLYRSQLARQQ
jgi:uncharacterized protein (TIGR02285 family)